MRTWVDENQRGSAAVAGFVFEHVDRGLVAAESRKERLSPPDKRCFPARNDRNQRKRWISGREGFRGEFSAEASCV